MRKPPDGTAAAEVIRLEHITKRFGGVTALNDVSFGVRAGEVHAVVGENGAGKSTLMKLLAGVQEQDSGKVYLDGTEVRLTSPKVSEELGIAMVYQELSLFQPLSITANLFIGRELTRSRFFLDEGAMSKEARSALARLMVEIDPRRKVGSLSTGQKQIVEIARAVSRGTRIVIMDEPNSALNKYETEALFTIIRHLKEGGLTILYVSHRLEEVFTIADSISVLRDGHYIGTWDKDETTVEEIVSKVVGRTLGEVFPTLTPVTSKSEIILSVQGLLLKGGSRPITFDLRRGEVLGLAGLEGSGVQDVFSTLFGLERHKGEGKVLFKGSLVDRISTRRLINRRWALIPADRRDHGLMLDWSILRNVSIVVIERLLSKLRLIRPGKEHELSSRYVEKLNISTDSLQKKVHNLSGGNQQKVVLAKWLASEPELLLLNDPTRGIDVGTKREVYRLISDWAGQGYAILFTSSEIEEVLGVSHRILVFYRGEIVREFDARATNKEEIMRYVLGGEAERSGNGQASPALAGAVGA